MYRKDLIELSVTQYNQNYAVLTPNQNLLSP